MNVLKKYKQFIIVFGILFWFFAKITGIKGWGTIIFGVAIIFTNMDDIIQYAKKIGIMKSSILSSVFIIVCGLTALIFLQISKHFTLSTILEMVIIALGLIIDLLILGYTAKKLERMK